MFGFEYPIGTARYTHATVLKWDDVWRPSMRRARCAFVHPSTIGPQTEALGCKAIRAKTPKEFKAAFARAKELMEQHQVPVRLEFVLERVTNISVGTEITDVNEFEEILCLDPSLSIRKGHDMRAAERAKEVDALAEKP